MLGTSVLIFALFALTPGDYVDGNRTITPERAAELKALYGLDKPLPERYLLWAGHMVTGDFGYSLQFKQPVTQLIGQYLGNSFLIAAISLILTWFLAMVVGILSATKHYSFFDGLVTFLVFFSMSFPSFFLGLLLIKWFSVDLGWFPIGGMFATGSLAQGWDAFAEVGWHMVLPVTVLTLLGVGSLTTCHPPRLAVL